MNTLCTLLDTALAANLSKRQWAAFAAVLRQTLGYRKQSDDLSPARLAQLTGIQRNHIWQAKNELVELGLLLSQPGRYGEILGFPDLDRSPPCPPATPDLGGQVSCFGHESVPKQDTTTSNHTVSNHNNIPLPQADPEPASEKLSHVKVSLATDMRWPAGLDAEVQRSASGLLCGLPANTAQDVLDVWGLALKTQTVRQPVGYLRALIRAAQAGELDTSGLPPPPTQTRPDALADTQLQAREQQAEWRWLEQMAALQGLPVKQVARQLGVKMRLPIGLVEEDIAAATVQPELLWRQSRPYAPPEPTGAKRSVGR